MMQLRGTKLSGLAWLAAHCNAGTERHKGVQLMSVRARRCAACMQMSCECKGGKGALALMLACGGKTVAYEIESAMQRFAMQAL